MSHELCQNTEVGATTSSRGSERDQPSSSSSYSEMRAGAQEVVRTTSRAACNDGTHIFVLALYTVVLLLLRSVQVKAFAFWGPCIHTC